jgi:anti-sigma factor RsiW
MNASIHECVRARELLSAVHDGEAARDAALERHLAGCPACARFEGEIARLSAELGALRGVEPPAALWARLEARAAAAERRSSPAWALRAAAGLIGFAGVAAAGAVVRSAAERPALDTIRGPVALLAAPGAAPRLVTPEDHLLRSVVERVEEQR